MRTPERNPKSTVPVRQDRGVNEPEPPVEVREVADALIGALGENLAALLWQGSWVRGEQTPDSDHDMIVVVKCIDDKVLRTMQDVFKARNLWSTYVKTEEELRQYPMSGRLQFHYGNVILYGQIQSPPVTREGLIEELRRTAVDVQHECRYRVIHGSGGGIDAGMDPAYPRMREARWMYYQAKLAVLALKTREVLRGRSYPANRKELRNRLTVEDELAVVDVIDRWPELRAGYEEDIRPLAIHLDRVMRNIVAELDAGLACMRRHFTATGFVVDGSRTLLHWHKRLQQWMPPGGHIEPDEDPVQAVLREIEEETGMVTAVIAGQESSSFDYPKQLPAPYTILIEDIPGPDEPHKHIDMIYFCRAIDSSAPRPVDDPTLRWVDEEELRQAVPLDVAGSGVSVAVPEDVRQLALIAIEAGRRAGGG